MATDFNGTVQIYNIVNSINSQSLGSIPITAVDSNSFISLGQAILSSKSATENFTNELVLRISRTISSFRRYRSKFRPIVFDDIRWGAVVQKIYVEMPEAEEDNAYDLKDGDSIDMYKVKTPKLKQKFFLTRTPYSFHVTIQKWQLQRAFLSESAFSAFINAVFGQIQNKLELTFERLGYTCVNNYIVNAGTNQVINLRTAYNNINGTTLSVAQAMEDNAFLRYAVAEMNLYSLKLADFSTLYNMEKYQRHTPVEMQRFIMLARFEEKLKTVVQWQAFHDQFVSTKSNIELTYWQNPLDEMKIMATNAAGKEVTVENVIGFIHDRDALGTYRKEQEVSTTPYNSAGRYYNTYYHEEQMWINDLSENGIVFTMN